MNMVLLRATTPPVNHVQVLVSKVSHMCSNCCTIIVDAHGSRPLPLHLSQEPLVASREVVIPRTGHLLKISLGTSMIAMQQPVTVCMNKVPLTTVHTTGVSTQ
jgi:hypothetical protein